MHYRAKGFSWEYCLRLMLVLLVSKHSLVSSPQQEPGAGWQEEEEEEEETEEAITILCSPQTDSPR